MSNLNKYLKLRAKIKDMQDLADELELEVREELSEVGGTYKTKMGTLYTSTRRVWEYHPDIQKEITSLKNRITTTQELAKEEGMATSKDVPSKVGFRHA